MAWTTVTPDSASWGIVRHTHYHEYHRVTSAEASTGIIALAETYHLTESVLRLFWQGMVQSPDDYAKTDVKTVTLTSNIAPVEGDYLIFKWNKLDSEGNQTWTSVPPSSATWS